MPRPKWGHSSIVSSGNPKMCLEFNPDWHKYQSRASTLICLHAPRRLQRVYLQLNTKRITGELAEGSKTTIIKLLKSHTIERHMVWSLVGLSNWGWFQQKWFHLAITGVPVLPRSCDCDNCGLKRCCLQTCSRRNWVHWSNYFVSSK